MSDNYNENKTIKRGKNNGYSNAKLRAKRQRKFEEACDRQADHDCLSLQEKIEKARSRRGKSKREIARLTKLAEAQGIKITTSASAVKETKPKAAIPAKKVAKKGVKK